MAANRIVPLALALCAVAVAALAVGPLLYRLLLPGRVADVGAPCSFVLVTGGLLALLVAALVWRLRRRRRAPREDLDRRLWEVALGDPPPPEDEG